MVKIDFSTKKIKTTKKKISVLKKCWLLAFLGEENQKSIFLILAKNMQNQKKNSK